MSYKNRIVGYGDAKPEDLLANPFNFRKHPKMQQNGMNGVLTDVGWVQSVIVNKRTGNLIDGHLRVSLAMRNEEKTIPVIYVDLSENEEKKVLATLDPLTSMASVDNEMLEKLLNDVSTDNAEVMELLAAIAEDYGVIDIEKENELKEKDGSVDINNVEYLQEKWGTAEGQLWQLGKHRMICGDATDRLIVTKLFGKDKPFMMVTDPPYGVEYDPEWREKALGDKKANRRKGSVKNDDKADWKDAWQYFKGDVIYCWHGALHAQEVLASFDAEFDLRSQLIWSKQHFAISRGHYHWMHEPCFYLVRKGATSQWVGDHSQKTVLEVTHFKEEKQTEGGHSTQKPIDCMLIPIKNHGKEGDVIYDPFLGTGTTIMACEIANRIGLGCEIDPKYAAVILERFEKVTGIKPVKL